MKVKDENYGNKRYYEKKYKDLEYEYTSIRKRLHWMEDKEAEEKKKEQAIQHAYRRHEKLKEEIRIKVHTEMEERQRIEQEMMSVDKKPKLFNWHGSV